MSGTETHDVEVVTISETILDLHTRARKIAAEDLLPANRSVALTKLEQASALLRETKDAHVAQAHCDHAQRCIHAARALGLQLKDMQILGRYIARSSAALGRLLTEAASPPESNLPMHRRGASAEKAAPTKAELAAQVGLRRREAQTHQEAGKLDEAELDAHADAIVAAGKIPTPRAIVDRAKRARAEQSPPSKGARPMTRDERERCEDLFSGGAEGVELAVVVDAEAGAIAAHEMLVAGEARAAIAIFDHQPHDEPWVAEWVARSSVVVLSRGRTVCYAGGNAAQASAFAMLWQSAGIVLRVL